MSDIRILLGKLLKPIGRYKKIKTRITEFLTIQMGYRPSKKQVEWCLGDYFLFRRKYKGSLETDYLGTQMFRKSEFVREESFSNKSRFKWRLSIQEQKYKHIFEDKKYFYESFAKYLHRKWMIVDKDTKKDDFIDFVKECGHEIIVKDTLSYGGKGVNFYKLKGNSEITKLYDLCIQGCFVVEEKIIQCEEINSFSGKAVNTFRIVTVIDDSGNVHIARAIFRIGRGNCILDNYSNGGIAAQIDIKSGIIYTTAQDKSGREYINHPDTGKQIVGYKISDWEEYKKFALELAEQYPTFRYVGWDILKNKDGVYCVIEGNDSAGFGAMESPLLYGLKPYFNALVKGKEAPYKINS